jgi:GTP cyclohydrolase II
VGPDTSNSAEAARTPLLQAEALHVTRSSGTFTVYVADHESGEHIVLVRGDVSGQQGVLCRVSSACVMSTALGSAECDCSDQLNAAMALIAKEERGILIYLVDQEGRGHGVKWKVRALRHKNNGMDTFAAVEELGLHPDVRQYDVVPKVLEELAIESVTLLTNNPEKLRNIEDAGVTVKERRQLEVCPPEHAWRHMEAKKIRGHDLTNSYKDEGEGEGERSELAGGDLMDPDTAEIAVDTAEIVVLGRWLPAVIAQAGDSNHDGAASTLSH